MITNIIAWIISNLILIFYLMPVAFCKMVKRFFMQLLYPKKSFSRALIEKCQKENITVHTYKRKHSGKKKFQKAPAIN